MICLLLAALNKSVPAVEVVPPEKMLVYYIISLAYYEDSYAYMHTYLPDRTFDTLHINYR